MTNWNDKNMFDLQTSIKGTSPHLLKDIKLKITDDCNLKCPKCDYWAKSLSYDLKTEIIIDLIDQGTELGLQEIQLSGGEPTLRKDLVEIIKYGVSKGIKYSIVSNGTNTQSYPDLIDAGLKQWTISLDTSDRKDYNKFTGMNERIFDKLIQGINYLVEKRNSSKISQVNIISVVTKDNYLQIPDLINLAKDSKVNSIRLLPYDYRQNHLHGKDSTLTSLNLSAKDIQNFNEVVLHEIKKINSEGDLNIYPDNFFIFGRDSEEINLAAKGDVAIGFYDKNVCYMPWHHLAVFANGDVYVCCKKPSSSLGNILNDSLKNMYRGENMNKIRDDFLKKKVFPSCRSCTSKLYENNLIGEKLD